VWGVVVALVGRGCARGAPGTRAALTRLAGRAGVAVVAGRAVRLRRARADRAGQVARHALVRAGGVAADAVRAEARRTLAIRRTGERERWVVEPARIRGVRAVPAAARDPPRPARDEAR